VSDPEPDGCSPLPPSAQYVYHVLDEEDDDEDLFRAGGQVGEGITVSISGVSADEVDLDDLPEQDRPDGDADEDEQEAVTA